MMGSALCCVVLWAVELMMKKREEKRKSGENRDRESVERERDEHGSVGVERGEGRDG